MAEYNQSSGEMTSSGTYVGSGYSGRGTDRNRTTSEHIPFRGPIPRGTYRMEYAGEYPGRGPVVIRLIPTGTTNTFGRNGFLIHGDNAQNDASEGCIILNRTARETLRNAISGGDNQLTVR